MGNRQDIVDIDGLRHLNAPDQSDEAEQSGQGRKWLAIKWMCCGVYSRIYRNRSATAYEGYCPKCARHLSVKIGEGGTSARLFEAY